MKQNTSCQFENPVGPPFPAPRRGELVRLLGEELRDFPRASDLLAVAAAARDGDPHGAGRPA